MGANDRRILDFHARSSAGLADLLYQHARSLESDFLKLGLKPLPLSRAQMEALPKGADAVSFLAVYRSFEAEYFSFLASCAWCIWMCGQAHSIPAPQDAFRRILEFSDNKKEWRQNIRIRSLVEKLSDAEESVADEAHEQLNTYLALLMYPDFRSRFPRTNSFVEKFAATRAQRVVWTLLLNAFADAAVRNFFDLDERDDLTSHLWSLLEDPDPKLRAAGKLYEIRFQTAVMKSLDIGSDCAGFNESIPN